MWEMHDDNWKGKGHKEKDNDIDININISVDKDGDTCFNKIDRGFGAAAGAESALNLCDVARGIRDVQSRLDDFGNGGVSNDDRDERIGRGAGGWGRVHGHERDAKDFEVHGNRDGELPYIDCEWGRLLEANKVDMLERYAKIGAALKGKEG